MGTVILFIAGAYILYLLIKILNNKHLLTAIVCLGIGFAIGHTLEIERVSSFKVSDIQEKVEAELKPIQWTKPKKDEQGNARKQQETRSGSND